MKAPRRWWERAMVVGLGVAALAAGLVVGALGCGPPCECGYPSPIEPGTYEIVDSSDRPELVGGMVEVASERVELSFTDAQGEGWVVDYLVVSE